MRKGWVLAWVAVLAWAKPQAPWLDQALVQAFSWKQGQVSAAKAAFTPQGWKAFQDAMSANIAATKARGGEIRAVLLAPAQIEGSRIKARLRVYYLGRDVTLTHVLNVEAGLANHHLDWLKAWQQGPTTLHRIPKACALRKLGV